MVDTNEQREPEEQEQEQAGAEQQPEQPQLEEEQQEQESDTFPRAYVEKLRTEAAEARVRAKDRDALAERLHRALTAATGRLGDPSDLGYAPEHLDDAESLTAAIDDLLARKPHLAARRVTGDVGQGQTSGSNSIDLAGMLRSRA